MYYLVQIIVPISIIVILPVLVVWIVFRNQTNKDNKNAEVLLKAIESNKDVDVDKMLEALNKRPRSARELLNLRLLRGCIFTLIGVTLAIVGGFIIHNVPYAEQGYMALIGAGISLAVGIAYIVVYFVSRKSFEDNNQK